MSLSPAQWNVVMVSAGLIVGLIIASLIKVGPQTAFDALAISEERRAKLWAGLIVLVTAYIQNHPELQWATPALAAWGLWSKTPGGK